MMQRRDWRGPVVFSYGFRPFFFSASALAAQLIGLWVPWHLGLIAVPSAFSPVDWHAHELLFGYVPAVVAGFLLTAVPNWTGRLPVVGWPLAALFAFWLLGRGAVMFSADLSPLTVFAATIAFPLALISVIAREIIAGRNWRNLKVLVGLGLIAVAQTLFHYEAARFGRGEYGARLAIAATILLILIVGGRIIPSFTRNWLKRENPGREPKEFGAFDKAAMIVGGVALAAWTAEPAIESAHMAIAILLLVAAAIHAIRLARWAPLRTFGEPLVAVLHIAYAFAPLGFALAGLALLSDTPGLATAALHTFTTGAIGLMTVAVMTRASRGHSGRPLTAPPSTQAIYLLIILATIARVCAALKPELTMILLPTAGVAWVCAFMGFAILYGPMLLSARPDAR